MHGSMSLIIKLAWVTNWQSHAGHDDDIDWCARWMKRCLKWRVLQGHGVEWAFCRESNSTRSLRHRKYSAQSSRSLATESHSSVNHFVLAFASLSLTIFSVISLVFFLNPLIPSHRSHLWRVYLTTLCSSWEIHPITYIKLISMYMTKITCRYITFPCFYNCLSLYVLRNKNLTR